MIIELGHFALVLALLVATVQSVVPLAGAARGYAGWMGVAAPAALVQVAAVGFAFLALTHAYVTSDFSVLNVAENSHSAKPLIYKITGVWGNHEGSMLLWVLILALFGAMVALFGGNLPASLRARVLSVQGMIGVGFLLFILVTSNPFLRLELPPIDGNDLNPVLQDPGLAFHPPLLYFGYVGFSMAFSFAVAALLEGRVDAAWARWVRPWTLAAWCGLTLGIALGSWWAYYELGWGGWWFWDPVENASLLPWLAGTALLHSAIVVEKRDAMKSWTVLLAILAFGLSLLGTFLVRSGVLLSVHSFAVDPARGIVILILMGLAVGGALTLYALRAPRLAAGGVFAPVSREGALVLNNLLLSTATATVLIGTLTPVVAQVFGVRLSVGPPVFDFFTAFLAPPLIAAMGIGPMLAWKRADLPGVLGRLKMAAAVTVAVGLLAAYWLAGGPVMAALGLGLAAWAILAALTELAERVRLFRLPLGDSWRRAKGLPRSAYGAALGHLGFGIAVAGMAGSAGWTTERIDLMRPGDTIDLAGYEVAFEGVEAVTGPNYQAERGRFVVSENGVPVYLMTPEKRWYPVAGMPTTEAAIRTTWIADLYLVLGEPREDGAWSVRGYHRPLVPWIWLGAAVMTAGGLVSLSDRRLRIGAPVRPRSTAAATPQAAE